MDLAILAELYYSNQIYRDVLAIHAICADSGLPRDDVDLYTYIHHELCIRDEPFEPRADGLVRPALLSLLVLLGQADLSEILKPLADEDPEVYESVIAVLEANGLSDFGAVIRNMDAMAEQTGFERYFTGALERRARLYLDPGFRRASLESYATLIAPRFPEFGTFESIITALEKADKPKESPYDDFLSGLKF